MWRTMKVLGRFTAADLAINSRTKEVSISQKTAQGFLHHLLKAGYVRKVSHGLWMMIPGKYTGPHPPIIHHFVRIYDQNLQKVVWSDEGGAS
jgi:hypothetical protein